MLVRHVDQRPRCRSGTRSRSRCAARTARSPTRGRSAAPPPRTRSTARPASSSSISSIELIGHPSVERSLRLLPLPSSWPARGRRARPRSSSLARRANDRKLSPGSRGRASRRPAPRPPRRARRSARAGTASGRSRARGRGRRARRCRRPGGARRPRRGRSCPGSRGRRPSAARRRAGSRRGGAAASAISSPKRSSRRSIRRPRRVFVSATEKLQCGSPVHAIELPRTGLMSSGKPIRVELGRSPRRGSRSGRR